MGGVRSCWPSRPRDKTSGCCRRCATHRGAAACAPYGEYKVVRSYCAGRRKYIAVLYLDVLTTPRAKDGLARHTAHPLRAGPLSRGQPALPMRRKAEAIVRAAPWRAHPVRDARARFDEAGDARSVAMLIGPLAATPACRKECRASANRRPYVSQPSDECVPTTARRASPPHRARPFRLDVRGNAAFLRRCRSTCSAFGAVLRAKAPERCYARRRTDQSACLRKKAGMS